MKIYYDNIIFKLQKAGGITTYWNHLLNRIKNVIEINDKKINRYFDVKVRDNNHFIFHSSYYRLCKNRNAINVTTLHDFTYEYFRKDVLSIIHKIQKKRAVLNSDGVICISENTKKDLEKFYPNYKGEIKIIYHGYDNNLFRISSTNNRDNYVIFIGARGSYKRFDLTVALLEKIPELNLKIIGGGDFSNDEINLLNEKIPNRYIKLGYIDNKELAEIYNNSFALAYPSSYEGFGFPVIEAQACGCPVICQNKSSIPEVSGNECIFIDENDLENSVNEIRKLFNKEFYKELQYKGLKNVTRFNWETCVKETYEFYEQLYKAKEEN